MSTGTTTIKNVKPMIHPLLVNPILTKMRNSNKFHPSKMNLRKSSGNQVNCRTSKNRRKFKFWPQ